VTSFDGARPAADLALALVSLRGRVATFRVTNHGPDAAAAVVAAGARAGEIAVGAERVVRVRYRRAGRYAATVRAATADANAANDGVAIRVR